MALAALPANATGRFISPPVAENTRHERPAFLGKDIHAITIPGTQVPKDETRFFVLPATAATPSAQVGEVISGATTDLVRLNSGYRQNLRPGIICTIEKNNRTAATLIIAAATTDAAIALILDLQPEQSITAGDTARIKTIHFN